MADVSVPAQIEQWIKSVGWSEHHDEWHATRRWDIYHTLAEQGDEDAKATVAYINAKGWQRAEHQEGAAGNGLDFLAMHRAMLQLLVQRFPADAHLFTGWQTPPINPADQNDPVADGSAFDPKKQEGIQLIEQDPAFFTSEDAFGIFIQTTLAPTPTDPLSRTPDARFGVHNYLHNRWADAQSPVNLGDPTVNIYNTRFWKLHGWIDHCWTTFRQAKQLSDNDPVYRQLLDEYTHMMAGHHHMLMEHAVKSAEAQHERPKQLRDAFREDL